MNDRLLRAPVAKFAFAPLEGGAWGRNPLRSFYEYRDLGVREASGGQVKATHIRIVSDPGPGTGWHCHDSSFQLVYVLAGFVRFRLRDGTQIILHAHDCAYLPAFTLHDEVEWSPDFQVLEITAPADVRTLPALPEPLPAHSPGSFVASHLREADFIRGSGPREFLEYRELGVTEATGRRVQAQVVRTRGPCDKSTGWHFHTLDFQLVYVLGGWVTTEIEGSGAFRMLPGDAMCVPSRVRHDVTAFSPDFMVLEINMPADFETVAG